MNISFTADKQVLKKYGEIVIFKFFKTWDFEIKE